MGNKNTQYLIDQAQAVIEEIITPQAIQRNMDASDVSLYVARQLTYNRAKAIEKPNAPLEAFDVFTVSTDIPAGAETAMQKIYSQVGMAKIVSNPADDIPMSDVYAEEVPVKVYTVASGYSYSVQDIINSAFAREDLPSRKAQASAMAIDRKINDIAWNGSPEHNIKGFLDNENVANFSVLADGTGNVTKLSAKTPAKMYRDINAIIDSVSTSTKGNVIPDTMLFSPDIYNLLSETIFVDDAGNAKTQTVLELIKANHPEITSFKKIFALANKGMVIVGAFNSDEYAKLEIPQRFSQEPVQRNNLELKVPAWGRVVGVTVNYPLAFTKATGL